MVADVDTLNVPTSQPRIAVIDPSTAVRTGLPIMLPSFTFAEGYASCAAALATHPLVDVLVLGANARDEEKPGASDLENVAACVSAGYRVCLYTLDQRPYFLARCLRAGAHGVVLKSDPIQVLVECIQQVASGETSVSGSVTLPGPTSWMSTRLLTPRQRQILAGRARGESFHGIARRLDISERTAQAHWSAIANRFEEYLRSHSPADLERSLGLDSGAAPLTSKALGRADRSV